MPEHSSNPQLQQQILRQALLEGAFIRAAEQDFITNLYLLILAFTPNPEQITREGYEGTRSVTPEAPRAEESEGASRSPEQPDPSALLKDAVTSGCQLTGGSLNLVGWRGERGSNDSAGAPRRGLERSPLPVTGPALNFASSGRSSGPPRGHALNAYDGIGQMLTAVDHEGNTTTVAYDTAGRKTSLNSPDAGLVTWEYDSNGDLSRKVDAVLV